MWTEITRRKYQREGQRYSTPVTVPTDWALDGSPVRCLPTLAGCRALDPRQLAPSFDPIESARPATEMVTASTPASANSRRRELGLPRYNGFDA